MKWLLLSDIFPLMLFCTEFLTSPSLITLGMITSRLFSLIFHLFRENRPYLINLDLIGIGFMALASPTACVAVECGHCAAFCTLLLIFFTIFLALALKDLVTKTVSAKPQTAVVFLAILGHYPCAHAMASHHGKAVQLSASAFLFAGGYFVVEPIQHTSWHWMAAMGQWLLLCACAEV
jgi:hypothetical protein